MEENKDISNELNEEVKKEVRNFDFKKGFYFTGALSVLLVLLFIFFSCRVLNTGMKSDKEFFIYGKAGTALSYKAKSNWYYDVDGKIYSLDGDMLTLVGQTVSTLDVTQDDFNAYIKQLQDTYELIPLELDNSYKVVVEENRSSTNYIVFNKDTETVYEMYFLDLSEEELDNIEKCFAFETIETIEE